MERNIVRFHSEESLGSCVRWRGACGPLALNTLLTEEGGTLPCAPLIQQYGSRLASSSRVDKEKEMQI